MLLDHPNAPVLTGRFRCWWKKLSIIQLPDMGARLGTALITSPWIRSARLQPRRRSRSMAVARVESAPAEYGEHLEAVITGRLRKALLLTFVILAVASLPTSWPSR